MKVSWHLTSVRRLYDIQEILTEPITAARALGSAVLAVALRALTLHKKNEADPRQTDSKLHSRHALVAVFHGDF